MTDNAEYLKEIKELLDTRDDNDTAPYMVYKFNKVRERYFGQIPSYAGIKKKDNDLVLGLEDSIRKKIESANNPLETAFMYARIGNYIDYGAMNQVDHKAFMELFDKAVLSEADRATYESFIKQCSEAKKFLLITDNCGEIVLDKLFLMQLKKSFPHLKIEALVRGGEALNDATVEDAEYVGLNKLATIYSNGMPVAGTVKEMLPKEARAALDKADVILAKGQGNYETMNTQGMHVFYSFLCKCDLFTNRFNVPRLTGIFLEER